MLFDKKGKEAEVTVSDGAYEVLCYAYSTDTVEIGMYVSGLSACLCDNISRAAEQHCAVSKLVPYFAFSLTGRVSSKQDRTVQVGGLRIELDAHLPNDISDGEYVSFDVLRLDVN